MKLIRKLKCEMRMDKFKKRIYDEFIF